jgi:hypothetical protein
VALHRRALRTGEHGRDIGQLVEPVDPRHAELAEHCAHDRVGTGEVAGVRLGHRTALARAPDLHAHDGLSGLGRMVGGQHQGATILEAFDVGRDDADLRLVEEVLGEVGELEVGLVARGCPVRQGDALFLRLEHGAALVPALGDEGDLRRRQIVAERLERVQVRVRAEQVRAAAGDQVLEPLLQRLTLGSDLVEAGGEDDGVARLLLEHGLEHLDRLADEDDGEVEVAGHVEHRREAPHAVDLVAVRVDGVGAGTGVLGPGADLPPHGGVGTAGGVRRSDHRDGLGVEEHVEIELAQGGGATGDVDGSLGHAADLT